MLCTFTDCSALNANVFPDWIWFRALRMSFMERIGDEDATPVGAESALGRDLEHLRVSVVIDVMARRLGESWVSTQVTDLGITGFELSSMSGLQPGDRIWVRFPGFDSRPARVDWAANQQTGCSFENPLHLGVFDYLLRFDSSHF